MGPLGHTPKGVAFRSGLIERALNRLFFRRLVSHSSAFGAVLTAFIPFAAWSCGDPEEVPRTIVALYDGDRMRSPRDTPIHRFAELPLNYLGYRLEYRDVSGGRPELPEVPVAATISWFDVALADPEQYAQWRATLTDTCGKAPATLVLGHTGLNLASEPTESVRTYLATFGVTSEPGDIVFGIRSEAVGELSQSHGFDTNFDIVRETNPKIVAMDKADSLLAVRTGDQEVDLVVLAPNALYAHDSALIRYDPRGGPLWVTDPFTLFEHALAGERWPKPDTTTTSGRRIFFMSIGPSGWLRPLPARQFGDRPLLASEVLEDAVVAEYTDLPITLGVLAGDLEPDIAGTAATRGRAAAEQLLAQPHVSPASSGLTMILDWDFFATYDETAEAATLSSVTNRGAGGLIPQAVETLGEAFADFESSALDIAPNAPRKYVGVPYDLAVEMQGAHDRIADLTSNADAPGLFMWSGNAQPFPTAVAASSEAGLANLGGGGGVATVTGSRLARLWPLGYQTAGGLQVYNALGADDQYGDLSVRNEPDFSGLMQTLQLTEEPRRLKPFHLNFSASSMLTFSSRQGVINNLEFAREAEIAPISAERYSAIVTGFNSIRVMRAGSGRWRIYDRGSLQTLRFENAARLSVDLSASEGVLGARRRGDDLFVALNPSFAVPLVAVSETESLYGVIEDNETPALLQARADVLSADRENCGYKLVLSGLGPTMTEWQGGPGLTYTVQVFTGGSTVPTFWQDVQAGEDGLFRAEVPLTAGEATSVLVAASCP